MLLLFKILTIILWIVYYIVLFTVCKEFIVNSILISSIICAIIGIVIYWFCTQSLIFAIILFAINLIWISIMFCNTYKDYMINKKSRKK